MADDSNSRFTRRDIFRGTFLGISRATGHDIEAEQARRQDLQSLADARSALARGEESVAEGHLRAFLKRNADRHDVRRDYALCLYRLGKFVQARVELVRLVRSGFADNRALAFLCLAQWRTGQAAKAAATLRSIDADDPDFKPFTAAARDLTGNGQPERESAASLEALIP